MSRAGRGHAIASAVAVAALIAAGGRGAAVAAQPARPVRAQSLVPAPGRPAPQPAIVALASSPADARAAIAIGEHGEVYAPDGHGAWTRRPGTGIAAEVVAASRAGDVAIAGVTTGAPFELITPVAKRLAGGWSVMNLGLHASALLGRGPRAVAAVGKTVFALERGKATKLADAPDPVLALAASGKAVVVETARGLARWTGKQWAPLAKAPRRVEALLDARWALVERGVVELDTGKVTPWPPGFHPQAATTAGDDTVVAASARDVVTIKAGAAARDALPPLASPLVAIAADRAGRVVIATRSGRLVLREHGAWTTTELRADPPAAHDGPPPAIQAAGPP